MEINHGLNRWSLGAWLVRAACFELFAQLLEFFFQLYESIPNCIPQCGCLKIVKPQRQLFLGIGELTIDDGIATLVLEPFRPRFIRQRLDAQHDAVLSVAAIALRLDKEPLQLIETPGLLRV